LSGPDLSREDFTTKLGDSDRAGKGSVDPKMELKKTLPPRKAEDA
jgi:hypothetical protein